MEYYNIHKKILVISIDGGGVRGALPAQFLKRLERELFLLKQESKLDKIFDIYAGTSTGSLIVAGIAYKQLNAHFISNYLYTPNVLKRIFSKTWRDRIFGLIQERPMYNNDNKRQLIKELVSSTRLYNDTDRNVIVTAYDITENNHKIFKSWENDPNLKLLDVLDASSSAPGYFKSCEYKKGKFGIDGGVFANNPTMIAYIEALELFGKNADIRILSIGTGSEIEKPIGNESKYFGALNWALEGKLTEKIIDAPSINTHCYMEKLTKLLGHKYIRINKKINNTSMDDISEKNIQLLKNHADELWTLNSKKVINLIIN